MRKSFRFKAKLSPSVARNAQKQLDLLRELYNAALEERITWYRRAGVSVSLYDQINQLTEIRRIRDDFGAINRGTCEEVLKDLNAGCQGFFRRVRTARVVGFPRFRSSGRFDSMRYRAKGGGFKMEGRRLTLAGVGCAKLFLSRPIEGAVKTVTLKRDRCGDWFVTFSCEDVPQELLPLTGQETGIDLGLTHFATLADGSQIANPRHLRTREHIVKRAQRRLSKMKRGGSNRRKWCRTLARRHRAVADARKDFAFKTARELLTKYDLIAVEDLNVHGLARTRMARSIHDAAWSQFTNALSFKAECAGKKVVFVNPRGTSQVCSGCGCEPATRKTLAQRTHHCTDCGLVLDRDHNAALNVLTRARAEPVTSGLGSKTAA